MSYLLCRIPNTPLNATLTSHNDVTLRRFSNPMYEGDTAIAELMVGNSSTQHTREARHTYEAIRPPPPTTSNTGALENSTRGSMRKRANGLYENSY